MGGPPGAPKKTLTELVPAEPTAKSLKPSPLTSPSVTAEKPMLASATLLSCCQLAT